MNSRSKLLMGAALGGILMAASCGGSDGSNSGEAPAANAMGECHGINACKGQSACHTKEHACAGQNSCKGKGWLEMSKSDCDQKGGNWQEMTMQM